MAFFSREAVNFEVGPEDFGGKALGAEMVTVWAVKLMLVAFVPARFAELVPTDTSWLDGVKTKPERVGVTE